MAHREPAAGPGRRRPAAAALPVRVAAWFATLRDALDRPLTSYYLLLGASGAAARPSG